MTIQLISNVKTNRQYNNFYHIFRKNVASYSDPDLIYTVTATSGHKSSMTCTCKGYVKYNKCKHIDKVHYDLDIAIVFINKVFTLFRDLGVVATNDRVLEYLKVCHYLCNSDTDKLIIQNYRVFIYHNLYCALKKIQNK